MTIWKQIYAWNITRVINSQYLSASRAAWIQRINTKVFIYGLSTARFTAVLFLFAMLNGCASQTANPAPGLKIDGLIIENQTQMWVSAARLLVPVTGAFVSCGNISPETRCATSFPEADYTGNPVQITWSQAGQIYSTGEFVVYPPDDVDLEKPALVRVVISAPGTAGAVIVQGDQASALNYP